VREDYSDNGDAWNFFTHDHARSRAYRWGEDGLGGISDDKQHLCFALALWNGKDPILKERLFGLTNSEGNHGEDVKEYYFYLDSTPTHSYMKFLYKYPQAAYPYADLVETNRRRSRNEFEYELLDTGVFEHNRYFDVFVEYAKAGPEDILVQITAANRGPEEAELHVLPTLWFRNDWASWVAHPAEKPMLTQLEGPAGASTIAATHPVLGAYRLYCEGDAPLLFTENETNHAKLHLDYPDASPYLKDGVNNYVVQGQHQAVNPERRGTKAAAHYRLTIGPGRSATVRLRLTAQAPAGSRTPTKGSAVLFGKDFDETLAARLREADAFYKSVTPPSVSPDAANVMRQAIAGMLWSKQYYYWDGNAWLEEHRAHPLHHGSRDFRNREWFHMINDDIISMPDKWEYPWYAAWDLAFHTLPIGIVDPDFAKEQLRLMLHGVYLHPSGQIPAYEWNFSDVNPPVHAFATLFLHRTEQALRGEADVEFLKAAFNKLALNFTWWVNRKDRFGKNVFEGGFLGRHSGRRPGSRRENGIRLDLAAQRLADGAGRATGVAREPRVAEGVRGDPAALAPGGHRLGVLDHRLHGAPRPRRGRGAAAARAPSEARPPAHAGLRPESHRPNASGDRHRGRPMPSLNRPRLPTHHRGRVRQGGLRPPAEKGALLRKALAD
jgi:Mannosylglycerate hydrolase MGH1-like glycoside hydrolase domain